MKAILYIGHGTRSKKGADEARAFLHKVIERVNVAIQEICFLELTEPLIEEGFRRCVEKGATEITVVPLFLLAAGHIKEDIPQAIFHLRKRYPQIQVNVRTPFGEQVEVLDGLAELVRNTAVDLNPLDSILIVGRGGSDPSIHTVFAKIAEGIKERLGVEQVSVCYLAAAEPRLQVGLESILQNAVERVIVIPYLLFSGLLLTEVNQNVRNWKNKGQQIIQTGPLSWHRAIEDIVIQCTLGE